MRQKKLTFLITLLLFTTTISLAQKDNALAQKGINQGKKGNYEKALTFFNQALEINSENYNALYYSGFSNENLENFEKATEFYTKTLELKETGETLYRRGYCYFRVKDYTNALNDYNNALKYLPGNEEIIMSRASVYLKTEEYQLLLDDLNFHLAKSPSDYYSKANKAMALSKIGRNDESLGILFELLKEMPPKHKAQLYNAISETYRSMEDDLKALEFINKSIEERFDYANAHITKAEILIDLGKKDEACESFQLAKKYGIDLTLDIVKEIEEVCK
nr:tetratricopeptide repeat protein [uncultured Carboxylicivirga sp.]